MVAGFAIAGELALIAQNGTTLGNPGLPLSMSVAAAVVVWLTAGVLEGGPIRLSLVLLGLAVAISIYTWDVLAGRPGVLWPLVNLLLALGVLVSLLRLVNSPYHRWQRRHHDLTGIGATPVLVLAGVVGALGPMSDRTTLPALSESAQTVTGSASAAWTICPRLRHIVTVSTADPAKPNQNGASTPHCWAITPPSTDPAAMPPTLPIR